MPDLRELYQELILDHNRRPRNHGRIETPDCKAEGYNPLCGDRVTVFVNLDEDVVKEITFEGSGCAISTASASLMTEAVKGRSLEDTRTLFTAFHSMLTNEGGAMHANPGLGKLAVFSGVSQFPARVKCATLVWHTLRAALESNDEVASTE